MNVPSAVAEALGDETVSATVSLKGEDALYVTPTRTIHYGAEGFLSDESVESYPHEAERVTVEEGRRKSTITFDYGTDGTRSLTVPEKYVSDSLHPILAGVFRAREVIEPGETVSATYRFGELTLVVTNRRLVKHVGAAVWDEEYVAVPYESVQGLETEKGSVASQLVISTPDRTERIKTPNEGFRRVDETIRDAIYQFYEVPDQAAFEAAVRPAEDEEPDTDEESTTAGKPEPAESAAFVSAVDTASILDELDELEALLDDQETLLEEQLAAIEDQRSRLDRLRSQIED
ncbi:DUF7115 domain-containing protein [Halodesulfurarchaeum formicicum]|uniref:YokE-like PH domain-containing protein n=1 Tax=Halodesulfurarchaeum formicicum TaxID=1873524 RepID=A0A1J1AAX2_9EURY|nr:PH domain-containing protein [Halodesulfurarchaeum formicicum]APE94931.1 hypothetical protein HSR6_0467 [Halodesulfurarchaeum formicicum]